MTTALHTSPSSPKRTTVKPTTQLKAKAYQSANPYNGRILKTFEELTDPQLETAIATAAKCFKTWRNLTFAERAAIVAKAAATMRENADDFAKPMTLEMGKLIAESLGEVALSADIMDYYAKNAERFLATETLQPESGEAEIVSNPLGVLFGVQPWNFPYYQLARFAAPNLMAGNVVMVKHAGSVPQCAIAFDIQPDNPAFRDEFFGPVALFFRVKDEDEAIAAVCHAPAIFKHTKGADGMSVVSGRRVTGFSNTEEEAVGLTKMVPFLVEDMLKANGGLYESGPDWGSHVVVDGKLVTGQNPASSEAAAKELLKLL